jgi:hypothetical protein
MSVDGLNELDLSYTPPFGSPWDAVQLAAQDWSGKRRLAPGPLLFFDLAEDWLDAVLASAYRALPSLGVAERCRRRRRRSPPGVDHAGGGIASGDHRGDAVLAGHQGGMGGQGAAVGDHHHRAGNSGVHAGAVARATSTSPGWKGSKSPGPVRAAVRWRPALTHVAWCQQ